MLLVACAKDGNNDSQKSSSMNMNQIAERYVKLVLAMGQHDSDYVDAYYGDPAWKKDAETNKRSLDQIKQEAQELMTALEHQDHSKMEPMEHLRSEYLYKQLSALNTRAEMLGGKKLKFDEE